MWEKRQEAVSILGLKIGVLVIFSSSLLIFLTVMINKDRARMDNYKKPVANLRKVRRELRKKQLEEKAQADQQGDEEAPVQSDNERSDP